MRKACEFHFFDGPPLEARLAYLRQGIGYGDLADDLFGYGSIGLASGLGNDTGFDFLG